MKKALLKSAIEKYRALDGNTGIPDVACEYIVLDGTRAQVENWEPWQKFKDYRTNYLFYYVNLDGTQNDETKFDIVDYAVIQPEGSYYPLLGEWNGARPGDTMIVRYNAKEGIMTNDVMFVKGNIEENINYYIIDEPDTPAN